jgi:hypothetical protein
VRALFEEDDMHVTFTSHQLVALEWRFGKEFRQSPEFKEWWKTEANDGKRKDNAIVDLHDARYMASRREKRNAM